MNSIQNYGNLNFKAVIKTKMVNQAGKTMITWYPEGSTITWNQAVKYIKTKECEKIVKEMEPKLKQIEDEISRKVQARECLRQAEKDIIPSKKIKDIEREITELYNKLIEMRKKQVENIKGTIDKSLEVIM